MKLNFWQWIGLGLLLVGVAFWIYERTRPERSGTPTTQPTSLGPLHAPAAVPPVV